MQSMFVEWLSEYLHCAHHLVSTVLLAAWLSSLPGPLPVTAKGTGAARRGTESLREIYGCPMPLLDYLRPTQREAKPASRRIGALSYAGGYASRCQGVIS